MSHSKIYLVGTNHVSKQSITKIDAAYTQTKPKIIAVELDKNRYVGLLHPQKQRFSLALLRRVGVVGYFFGLIGRYVQQRIAKKTGMQPGHDMLYGCSLAKNNNLLLALIDRPIDQTLRTLTKQLTWKERRRFLYDITLGLLFPVQKVKVTFSPEGIPNEDVLTSVLESVKERYPTLYDVLITQRNIFMVNQLLALQQKHPDMSILVIIGAGHVQGMRELLAKQMTELSFNGN